MAGLPLWNSRGKNPTAAEMQCAQQPKAPFVLWMNVTDDGADERFLERESQERLGYPRSEAEFLILTSENDADFAIKSSRSTVE